MTGENQLITAEDMLQFINKVLMVRHTEQTSQISLMVPHFKSSTLPTGEADYSLFPTRSIAKWSPVAPAWHRMLPEPEVILLKDIEDHKVIDIEDIGNGKKRATVARPRKCTLCRECIREGMGGFFVIYDVLRIILFAKRAILNDYIIGGVKPILPNWSSLRSILPRKNVGFDNHSLPQKDRLADEWLE